MKSTTKYLSLAALALMGTLASCQSDDEAATNSFARPANAVGINVSVGSLQTTRSNPAATDPDEAHLFNLGDQVCVSTEGQDPVLFQCTNADQQTWAEAVPGKFLLWKQSEMTFQAYYPATEGTSMTAFTLPADQSTEAKIALADYMTRQQTCNNESGTDINLSLERKMARVIVRIAGFNDQYDNDAKTVSNVRIYSQFSAIADGNPTGSSTEIQPYAQGNGGQGSTYTALVVPGYDDDGARFIQLSDGENSTLEVKGIPELEVGNSYTFNLTVGKNTIQVQSVTVEDWTTGETLAGGQATEDPSVTEVTTFSELQTALSAGKDVKLMNDIDCTAEINITSNGPLTIDGNGKKLSTTSEIRAFKVGSSATVAFKNLTLTGFVSGGGPAINNSGTIVLDGCTISNCHVSNNNGGGAIENKSGGKLYAINTTFSGNYSGEIGGAINNYNSSLYMSGCTFTDNYTTRSDAYYGGAIGINRGSEVRLINCSFSGNKYGTNIGTNDIGVFYKPENYTIAGCTGATIASGDGDITTNTSGTATLDYSDLSNISFTYTAEGSAVEGHALSASAVGEIVGTDGKAYAVADKGNLPEGVTAVAMVAYKSETTGSSLAIALADEGSMNWSSAKSTCEGKTAIGGNSWKLPTQDEWKQMFKANGNNEGNYTGLNTALAAAGGESMQGWALYWSSTPNGEDEAYQVYLSDGSALWGIDRVGEEYLVRACLAF